MNTLVRTIVVLLLVAPVGVLADGVSFNRIALSLSDDDRILLDADIGFDLNDTVAIADFILAEVGL